MLWTDLWTFNLVIYIYIFLFLNFISFDCSINGRSGHLPSPQSMHVFWGNGNGLYSLLSIKQKWDTVWYPARILYWMLTVILPLTNQYLVCDDLTGAHEMASHLLEYTLDRIWIFSQIYVFSADNYKAVGVFNWEKLPSFLVIKLHLSDVWMQMLHPSLINQIYWTEREPLSWNSSVALLFLNFLCVYHTEHVFSSNPGCAAVS